MAVHAVQASSFKQPLPLDTSHVPAAAEVMEVNAAVAALREQLSALQSNTDESRTNMIKLNLREAEEILRG